MTSAEIRIEPAVESNAEALAEISRRAFDNDVDYGAPGPGGPPGYDSPDWQREMIRDGRYFQVLEHGLLVGGFVLLLLADGSVEFGRAFLEPEFQNRGIGCELLRFAERVIPGASRIVLDTPEWNLRTQHFYKKAGYVKIGELDTGEGFLLFQYEKRLGEPNGG